MNIKILKIMMCCFLMNGFAVAADEAKEAEGTGDGAMAAAGAAKGVIDEVSPEEYFAPQVLDCVEKFLKSVHGNLGSVEEAVRLITFYQENRCLLDSFYLSKHLKILKDLDGGYPFGVSAATPPLDAKIITLMKAAILCITLNVAELGIDEGSFKARACIALEELCLNMGPACTWMQLKTLLSIDDEGYVKTSDDEGSVMTHTPHAVTTGLGYSDQVVISGIAGGGSAAPSSQAAFRPVLPPVSQHPMVADPATAALIGKLEGIKGLYTGAADSGDESDEGGRAGAGLGGTVLSKRTKTEDEGPYDDAAFEQDLSRYFGGGAALDPERLTEPQRAILREMGIF